MAECPYLDYKSNNYITTSSDKYICKLSGQEMYTDDTKVKYTCKPDYGEEYKKCPYYKDR